jgi:hypothetical protein
MDAYDRYIKLGGKILQILLPSMVEVENFSDYYPVCEAYDTPQKPHSSVSTHPRRQPAATWVNIMIYCKYCQVLLMMGENIARNM